MLSLWVEPVSYPFDSSVMNSWALASLAALYISSSEASSQPYLMFSRTERANSTQSWLTTAIYKHTRWRRNVSDCLTVTANSENGLQWEQQQNKTRRKMQVSVLITFLWPVCNCTKRRVRWKIRQEQRSEIKDTFGGIWVETFNELRFTFRISSLLYSSELL